MSHEPPRHLVPPPYRTKALQLAHRIRARWERSPEPDPKSLVDDVQTAFAEEANHELRQVLFQVGAQLELASVKAEGDDVVLSQVATRRLTTAIGRATAVVEAYLDRGEAAKMVMDLHVEVFDLGAELEGLLRWNGFLDGPDVEMTIDPITIAADRELLLDVLGHMASRFHLARSDPERVRFVLRDHEDHVEGFFGLIGSTATTQDLMTEFDRPLEMDDMEIDMPYTRAIIERHGGILYVAAGPENASGFGFTLPKRPDPHPEV